MNDLNILKGKCLNFSYLFISTADEYIHITDRSNSSAVDIK